MAFDEAEKLGGQKIRGVGAEVPRCIGDDCIEVEEQDSLEDSTYDYDNSPDHFNDHRYHVDVDIFDVHLENGSNDQRGNTVLS